MLRRLSHLLPGAHVWLPARCALCGGPGNPSRDLCAACAKDLVRNVCACPRCALPLARAAAACGRCLKRAPPFFSAYAPFCYAYPLDGLIARFKFGADLAAGRVLTGLWVESIGASPGQLPDLIVPVPLHVDRLVQRGYNQALELARPIAKHLGINLAPELMARVRATAAQTGLDTRARRRNVRHAFALQTRQPLPAHIALFDDVMTTGATLAEAARVLKLAGVERVDAWAMARAPAQR